jgi:hypothetical protein
MQLSAVQTELQKRLSGFTIGTCCQAEKEVLLVARVTHQWIAPPRAVRWLLEAFEKRVLNVALPNWCTYR